MVKVKQPGPYDALLANYPPFCVCYRIHRHALWIMGEYANSKQDILDVTDEIKKGLGDVSSRFYVYLWCNWR